MPVAIPGLNPEQNEAVLHDGHALVVAIPGSGKTRVLQEKTVYLLKREPQARIVVCTFTRDAADEVRSRILAAYPDANNRLIVGTFHSLCLLQLKSASKKIRIISEAEQRHMLRQALTRVDMRISFTEAVGIIDYFKSRDPATLKSDPGYPLYLAYQEMLERHQASDFSDILLKCVSGMKDGSVHPLSCEYMLVDEAQDTDLVQLSWVLTHIELGKGRIHTTVVGDDDQSIYGWRAASGYPGMMEYQRYTNAKLITLDTNYRSKSEILLPASKLIKHNKDRISKELKSYRGPGGKVDIKCFNDLQHEVEAVVQMVRKTPEVWAVLARTNGHLDLLESELSREDIPYSRSASGSFWSLDAVHTFTSLIESICSGSELGIEKSLLLCGIRRKQIEEMKLAGSLHHSLLKDTLDGFRFTVEQKESFFLFKERYKKWSALNENKNYPMVLLGLMQWISYHAKLKEKDVENIAKAQQILFEKNGSLLQRLNSVKQLNQKNGNSQGVQLLTLHSSKGLEFPNVWLIHANEETMPHKDSMEDIDEERCLFYVGMTRAKDHLIISYSNGEDDEYSRFLTESGFIIDT